MPNKTNWYLIAAIAVLFGYASFSVVSYYIEWREEAARTLTGDYTHTIGIETSNNVIRVSAELALDDERRILGMMFRSSMEDYQGMLFVFSPPQILQFWMKNTLIPLDLLFIGVDGRIVHIHENAIPHDETLIPSVKPAIAVLEVKGGMAKAWGVKEGDIVHSPFLMH